MFNKKGQRSSEAPLLSPLKIVFGFFLIIIALVILFAVIAVQVDKNESKVSSLVSSTVAKEKWLDILYRDVDGELVIDILDKIYLLEQSDDDEKEKKIDVLYKKVKRACVDSVKEILPAEVEIMDTDYGIESGWYGCEVQLGSSSLKVKTVSELLKGAGFEDYEKVFGKATHVILTNYERKEQVPNRPFRFTFFFHNSDSGVFLWE